MKGNKISKRYAQALFGIAANDTALEKIKTDTDFIEEVCQSRDFRVMLGSPVIKPSIKKEIFKSIFEKSIDQNTLLYLYLLIDNRREGMLEDICFSFKELYDKHKQIIRVFVSSAVKLSDSERKEITELVKKATRNEVILNESINENILGGFILRYGDTQIDNSVSSQLTKVKQQLTQRIQ